MNRVGLRFVAMLIMAVLLCGCGDSNSGSNNGGNGDNNASGADGSSSTESSRFDAPVQPEAGNESSASRTDKTETKNPNAGIGFGDVVAVSSYWKSRFRSRSPEQAYEILSEPPGTTPPTGWNVEADPPPEPLAFTGLEEGEKIRIQIPTGSGRPTAESILFPPVPSTIVCVGQNSAKNDVREVWDLAGPTRVGTIRGIGVRTRINAISPDGAYFAGIARTQGLKEAVGLYDVENEKTLSILSIEDMRNVAHLAFPRPDRLVAGPSFDGKFRIWEIPSGQVQHDLVVETHGGHIAPAYSPGGRYVAARRSEFGKDSIVIVDLETGITAGELPVPEYPGHHLRLQGMAFSPDGKELAAVTDAQSNSKVLIWNVATGEIADHMTFRKTLKQIAFGERSLGKKATALTWFPGNERLLAYERVVLDRELGASVWQLPAGELRDRFPGKRWALSESHLTVLTTAGGDGFVTVYELPEEKIARAREQHAGQAKPAVPVIKVQQGASTTASTASAEQVVSREVEWSLQADPAPPAAPARPCRLSQRLGKIRHIGLSQTGAARALVLRSTKRIPFQRLPGGNIQPRQLNQFRNHSRPSAAPTGFTAARAGKAKQEKTFIDVYDLSAGERTRELQLNYDGDLTSVSPDGSRFVVMTPAKASRIDIYAVEDGRHVAGWVPYRRESEELARMTVSAVMSDAEHVVTLSGTGRLVVWELSTAEAILVATNASQPEFTAGGKYLGYCDGEAYNFVELATGQLRGRLTDVGDVRAAACHPDGSRFALLTAAKGRYFVLPVDLETGQAESPFPVPLISPFMRWLGDRYLLLDNRKLVDVAGKAVAWSYELQAGNHVPAGPGDRHWYVADADGQPVLCAQAVPGSTAESRLAGANIAPEFVLQPGGSCSLVLKLQHPVLDAQYKQELRSKVEDELAEDRITVAEGQSVTLVLETFPEETGKRISTEYRSIGFGGSGTQKVEYQKKTTRCRVAFMVDGKPAWQETRTIANGASFLSLDEGTSIEQAIEEQYRKHLRRFFRNVVLPPYVFTPRSSNGLGTTALQTRL